ncbi:LLM class flavin-dependent oxidoreductase [Cryptosporangium aurantiacum]|uniref:Luciferase-like monooxygenase n=1 Tax=Cryptosporangium aurantiacum TaxID=134849 RepID=A0A1M7KA20_9ACTN|nr:LLM class flavin-dependent oxidoreductase [Cryptosporangium aurantiacum]SHM61813.1 Luciferase-like monooxygenase [Cryptosporangium aurantiacum]
MTHLAVEIDGPGAHPAAGHTLDPFDPDVVVRSARLAEDAGFVLVTLADAAQGGLEAGVRAAYLALRTHRIGLAPTLHVTTTEPFHLATQLASLDHASQGRGGWVVGAQNTATALATTGREPLEPDALRREVADVVEVNRALWDSWEDDATIRDVATGRFLDPDRVHHVNFTGDTFSIVGPLITPRPPQGQVVVLGADTLGVTGQLDIALVGGDVAARAAAARAAGAPLVFAEVEVLIDESGERRDTADSWAPSDRLRHVGSVAALRDLIDRLGATVDGVRLHPAETAVDLPLLAEALPADTLPAEALPADAGRPASSGTLRERLGLPRPANRFAATVGEATP